MTNKPTPEELAGVWGQPGYTQPKFIQDLVPNDIWTHEQQQEMDAAWEALTDLEQFHYSRRIRTLEYFAPTLLRVSDRELIEILTDQLNIYHLYSRPARAMIFSMSAVFGFSISDIGLISFATEPQSPAYPVTTISGERDRQPRPEAMVDWPKDRPPGGRLPKIDQSA